MTCVTCCVSVRVPVARVLTLLEPYKVIHLRITASTRAAVLSASRNRAKAHAKPREHACTRSFAFLIYRSILKLASALSKVVPLTPRLRRDLVPREVFDAAVRKARRISLPPQLPLLYGFSPF